MRTFTTEDKINFETLYYPTIQEVADKGCDYIVEHLRELNADIYYSSNITDNNKRVKNGHIEFDIQIKGARFTIVLDKYTQQEDDTCYTHWHNKELSESAVACMKCNIGTDYVVYPKYWDED